MPVPCAKEEARSPEAALSDSEVIALAIFVARWGFARWGRFSSERDFFRYAQSRLREAFPTLPDRSRFNRLVRSCVGLSSRRWPCTCWRLCRIPKEEEEEEEEEEPTKLRMLRGHARSEREAKGRGMGLAGHADIGWSNTLGWYEGFRLLVAVAPTGGITGFGFASASTEDQPRWPKRSSPCGLLNPTPGSRAWDRRPRGLRCSTRASRARTTTEDGGTDTGRGSSARPSATGARGSGPSECGAGRRASARSWRECLREAARHLRPSRRAAPRVLSGLRARLAARVALHNFCIWLNEQLGRPRLSFADLLGW